MSGALSDVRGFLFDLDGVVHVGSEPIPGAAETLAYLDQRGVPYVFVTNTTTESPESLHRKLSGIGLPIARERILTTHEVAAAYLRRLGAPPVFLLVAAKARRAYSGIPVSETGPEYVVIGDIGSRWNYSILNRVFNWVMDGSRMLALHKGRYWKTERGLQIDIGAFVAGLEYCTGQSAVVIGKPSAAFFEAALAELGLARQEVVMVGDDIESDVGGAQRAGIRGVLVKTGKYRPDAAGRSSVRPDAVLSSIAEIREFL